MYYIYLFFLLGHWITPCPLPINLIKCDFTFILKYGIGLKLSLGRRLTLHCMDKIHWTILLLCFAEEQKSYNWQNFLLFFHKLPMKCTSFFCETGIFFHTIKCLSYNRSQWDSVLSWTPLMFIAWTKIVGILSFCILHMNKGHIIDRIFKFEWTITSMTN